MLITEAITRELQELFAKNTVRALKTKFPSFSETTIWRMKAGITKIDLQFVYVAEKHGYIKPLKQLFKNN